MGSSPTLIAMGNYLYSLCGMYGLTAQYITGSNGGVAPVSPVNNYKFTSLPDSIVSDSTTYQNSALVSGKDLGVIIVNDQNLQAAKSDFTFDPVTGTVTFVAISLFAGDKITLLFNQKV